MIFLPLLLASCGVMQVDIRMITTNGITPSETAAPAILHFPPAWTSTPPVPAATQRSNVNLTSLAAYEPGRPLAFSTVKMMDTEKGWAVTTDDHIVTTADGGTIWKDVTPPGGSFTAGGFSAWNAQSAWAAPVIAANSLNPVASGVVWYTADGGSTWQQVILPLAINGESADQTGSRKFEPQAFSFVDEKTGWLLVRINGEKETDIVEIFHTADGGAIWERLTDSLTGSLPHCAENISFSDRQNGLLISSCPEYTFGKNYQYSDFHMSVSQSHAGGKDWQSETVSVWIGHQSILLGSYGVQIGPITCAFHSAVPGLPELDATCSSTKLQSIDTILWLHLDGPNLKLYSGWGDIKGSNFSHSPKFSDWQLWEYVPAGTNGLAVIKSGWSLTTHVAWQHVDFFCLDMTNCWVNARIGEITAFLRTGDGGKTWAELKPATADPQSLCATGKLSQLVHAPTGNTSGGEFTLAFSPDWNMLATARENSVRLWNAATSAPGSLLEGHTGKVISAAFSPDGVTLATGGADGQIRLWDVPHGKILRTLNNQNSAVESLAFSPDGHQLASGSWDYAVRLWRVADGQLLSSQSMHHGWIKELAFSPSGSMLASASADHTVMLWDVSASSLAGQRALQAHTDSVESVAFSPDSKRLASASADGTVALWDVASGALQRSLTGFPQPVTGVAFSPDGKLLLIGTRGGSVQLWRAADGASLCSVSDLANSTAAISIPAVAFSPDGNRAAWGSSDGTVWVWGK